MNPFPDWIILPTTAHRIPQTPGAQDIIHRIFLQGINASAFLMDVDLLAELEGKGFQNDLDCIVSDLIAQLPRHIQDAVFPPPPPDPDDEGEDSDEEKDSAPVKGPRLKISMHDALVTLPKAQSEVSPPKNLKPLPKIPPPHHFEDQQKLKKKKSGLSLGM